MFTEHGGNIGEARRNLMPIVILIIQTLGKALQASHDAVEAILVLEQQVGLTLLDQHLEPQPAARQTPRHPDAYYDSY